MKQKTIPTLLAFVTILVLWQVIAVSIHYPAIFPDLKQLATGVFHLFTQSEFYIALSLTILRGLIGFIISFLLALALASVATFSDWWKQFFHPFLVFMRSVPVISLVLIALLWFSPEELPIFIALLTMFPILYSNILNGMEHTDKRWVEMAHVFGKSKKQIYTQIYLPAARKTIFTGISTAMGFGWRAIIIGEVLAQPLHGMGTAMKHAQAYINIPELIAWTAVAILVSFAFDTFFKYLSDIHISRSPHFHAVQPNLNIKQIEIQHLEKRFEEKVLFTNYSDKFDSSAIQCIKGVSGRGKSTLLKMISGILPPDKGQIIYDNQLSMAFSFQDIRLLPWLTVEENVWLTARGKDAYQNIEELLKKAGLWTERNRFPHEISGGQQRRAGLVRALASQSDILLLDEPLNGLDDELKKEIMSLITEVTFRNHTLVIWATHENIVSEGLPVRAITLL